MFSRLDAEGRLKTVNYSDALRAPYFRVPVEQVHSWYKAYTALNALMYNEENMIHVKLDAGRSVLLNCKLFILWNPANSRMH